MNKTIKKLIESGLTEKEALVYHAGLVLGPTTVLKLAQYTNLKRASIYDVVDSLVAQALFRIDEVSFKKVFVAEDPKQLLRVAEEKVSKVQDIIPDLEVLFKKSGKTKLIKTYEGLPALQAIIDRFMNETKSGEFRYGIGGDLGWHDIDPRLQEKYFKWRERITLDTRFIFQDSARANLHKSKETLLRNQVKVLPKQMKLNSDITITPRLMVIMKLSTPMTAIVIEDEEIISTYKELFLFMWDMVPE